MTTANRKKILLNAFNMNCVGHINHGLWTHPRDRSAHYTDLDYWADLAKTLERGKFDGIFLADIVGVYDVFGGGPDALRESVQVPVNDPLLLVPAMAQVTRHLGFGVTANLTYEPPYLFARRMSTLDHLTKGRVGWNIVTGYLDSAARGMGLAQQIGHDDRYERADDYMDVVYKLGTELGRRCGDPRREGARVRAAGQGAAREARRAVLFDRRDSSERAVAAAHAGAVPGRFVRARRRVRRPSRGMRVRERAKQGRARRHSTFARPPHGPRPGVDQDLCRRERRDGGNRTSGTREIRRVPALRERRSGPRAFRGSTGIDFAKYGLDEPISYVKTDSIQSAVDAISRKSTTGTWTVRRMLEQMSLGGRYAPIVGSPSQVADELQSWIDETGIDGFNLTRTVMPESFEDFVDWVVPELQNRGVYKEDYDPAPTLRELFGAARLPAWHTGAQHRPAPCTPNPRIPRMSERDGAKR